MAKYIDAEKLISEVKALKRRKGFLPFENTEITEAYMARGVQFTCDDVVNLIQNLQQEQTDTDGLYLELADFLTKNDIQEEKAKFLANRILDLYGSKKYLEGLCDGIKREQSEVDIEKEIEEYLINNSSFLIGHNSKAVVQALARHFYELGINARKEEE